MVWLCRVTALHFASHNGHTETALALVKAGVDVHGKTNIEYGFSGCILGPVVCHNARRTVRPLGVERQECRLGCAG